ncbi:TatD family hydrolase [Mycoplasmopsis columbina]|uniref:Mg-dependent dnase n=1 Tax=Mycoplasmopsis columbina SF7 TaxID=1037410 RepID=F9UJ37_9BACT|nr:TatD family hydrolase [Mycoplasmopsis columbina]EGV00600.1 mg-dependent dnase [Mycoplasmopsis columbina SF7]VEU76669.1 TatD DNase family protein [Mycoplasmopsis columbina]
MSIKYVDAHTHPLKCYYKDNYKSIEKAHAKGLAVMMVTGCARREIEEVKYLCKHFDYTYPVIGIHPNEATGKEDADFIESHLDSSIKAIGEIGLDYYWNTTTPEIQKESFIAQVKLAEKYNLPVVVHMRDAYEDLYEIIKQFPYVNFMIHTYSGDLEWAKKFYDLGCYFSFSGITTYKNAQKTIEVLDWLPVDRILTETDAPYLTPAQKRGEINYSNYVIFTTTFIAGVKKIPVEKFADQVFKNAKELFNLNVSRKK